MRPHEPALNLQVSDGVRVWTDTELAEKSGVLVAFSERSGGVSSAPFRSLNLAAHVGDDPSAVDENRTRLLTSLGIAAFREHLTVPDQVHGSTLVSVGSDLRGSGAYAAQGPGPIRETDALMTHEPGIPLILCFADCVPVVLVAPGPVVAVVHAGWRGALASLPGTVAAELGRQSGSDPKQIAAYIGPHIRSCHYPVSDEIMSQFVNSFDTLARAESGGLDLEAAVTASLMDAGVAQCSIARLGTCTVEATDRFFSYRAEGGQTGRHAALACILPRA